MANSIPEIDIPPAPDPIKNPAQYLRSIYAVRGRSTIVLDKAKRDQLNHFDVDMTKFQDTADYVVSIIKRDFAPDYSSIPPHGRWQHFEVGGRPRITQLLQSWPSSLDQTERTKRLVDLFVVSVLLDAGAGTKWTYTSKENGKSYARSEGLAVASLEMFKTGIFSSNPANPHQVDAAALQKLTTEHLAKGMQVSEANPMSGLDGRAALLSRLAVALRGQVAMFGRDARPGNMVDYLISHPDTVAAAVPVVPLPILWEVLMDGLSSIWPTTRTSINGKSLGDAWPCSTMPGPGTWENIVPFHKLTQWLCYSIMVPMTKLLNMQFAGAELQTGLPEYRNGGLLVDTGLLTLKEADTARGLRTWHRIMPDDATEVVPTFEPSDDVVVEWRAVTVGFLDELLSAVNNGLGLSGSDKLSLAQMLEAGTWKGGREIAQVSRPNTKGPPIGIISDGTVF
ncbi:hypothetical protein LTR64_005135 [Lithohypha guttulata]|uniref:uncharacterized protein n=1 Tax=Lithohypha guttulata TaxID=1690604 RepID=UPI002DE16B50|nr:hypothetical protein LTR51_005031 [Lithohypha guttulata]